MKYVQKTRIQKMRRAKRTRTHGRAASALPRLSVFRSNRHIGVQLIDDIQGVTILQASDAELEATKQPLLERTRLVGAAIGKKAHEKNIGRVRFDRGHRRYHGVIRALAEGARSHGLQF